MTRYVLRRLISGAVTLFLFVSVLFFLVSAVVPGDWTSQYILTGEQREAFRGELGLDRPLWAQYVDWIRSVGSFSLGTSFSGEHVGDMILAAFPRTLFVLVVGLGLAFVFGGWLGRLTAYRDNSGLTGATTFLAVLFMTAFPPVVAFSMDQAARNVLGDAFYGRLTELNAAITGQDTAPLLWWMLAMLVVALALLWLIRLLLDRIFHRRLPATAALGLIVGLPLLLYYLTGLGFWVGVLAGSMTPLIVGVVILTFGEVVLVTGAAMEDSMFEDYVMVARAKGLTERRVRDHHAARPALLPVLSRFTVSIPYFLTGLVILESVFSGPGPGGFAYRRGFGMGSLIFDAVRLQDTPVIVGSLLVVGALTVLVRVGLDVAHTALDPRIRFERAGNGR